MNGLISYKVVWVTEMVLLKRWVTSRMVMVAHLSSHFTKGTRLWAWVWPSNPPHLHHRCKKTLSLHILSSRFYCPVVLGSQPGAPAVRAHGRWRPRVEVSRLRSLWRRFVSDSARGDTQQAGTSHLCHWDSPVLSGHGASSQSGSSPGGVVTKLSPSNHTRVSFVFSG